MCAAMKKFQALDNMVYPSRDDPQINESALGYWFLDDDDLIDSAPNYLTSVKETIDQSLKLINEKIILMQNTKALGAV